MSEHSGEVEEATINELIRVADRDVILIEPAHELTDSDIQARMKNHMYVSDIKKAEALRNTVTGYNLLDYCDNPLNRNNLELISQGTESAPEGSDIQ